MGNTEKKALLMSSYKIKLTGRILLKIICTGHLKELNHFYGVNATIFRLLVFFEHLKTSLNFVQFCIKFDLRTIPRHNFSIIKLIQKAMNTGFYLH